MPFSIRLRKEGEKRLQNLANATGRTKSFYINELVEDGIEALEDIYLSERVLEKIRAGKETVHSLSDVEKALDMDN